MTATPVNATQLSDEELARAGSSSAFEILVSRHHHRLFHFLHHRTGSAHDAEDLLQETFVAAWRARDRYEPGRPFITWLFTIARHRAIDHHRTRRPTVPLTGAEPATSDHAPDDDLWLLARQHLSEKQFTALWLMYGEDRSIKEIARLMQATTVGVKVNLHRARQRLAPLLRRHTVPSVTPQPGGPSCSVSTIAG